MNAKNHYCEGEDEGYGFVNDRAPSVVRGEESIGRGVEAAGKSRDLRRNHPSTYGLQRLRGKAQLQDRWAHREPEEGDRQEWREKRNDCACIR